MIDPFELNWRHLRALQMIAERGSMSGAADAVGISQPALTQGLAKLERQLGVSLFQRRFDGVTSTVEGKLAAERVVKAFAELAAACRAVGRAGTRGFSKPEHLITATQLRAFLHVADLGSFTAAARLTGLSQPSLHRAVRDLEQIVSAPIVVRKGQGIRLTDEGHRLARGIRLATGEIAAAIAEVDEPKLGAGRLAIGAMPLCRALLLPTTIAGFTRERPNFSLEVIEGSWRDLVELLRDGQIDLMIGALRTTGIEGLEQTTLFTDQFLIVGRAGHPLAGEVQPSRVDLASFPWIVGQPGTPAREHWEAMFTDLDLPPAAPIACGSVMVSRGILRSSDFLTLLSLDQVALEIESGLLATIGAPPTGVSRSIGVVNRASWRPTSGQRHFLDLLAQQASGHKVQESE